MLAVPLPSSCRVEQGSPSLSSVAEKYAVQPRTLGKEATDSIGAELAAASLPAGSPPPAVKVDIHSHVVAAQNDSDCAAEREELLAALNAEPLFREYAEQCDSGMLRRYLSARSNNVEKAKLLLLEALQWRRDNLSKVPDFNEYDHMATQGALRVTGLDCFGRAVVVLDAGALRKIDEAAQLRFIEFTLAHAIRRMEGSSVEKFVIFLQLSKFRMATSPSRTFLRDACKMLSICFPERCGNMIFYQAPRLFSTVFRLCSPFIDPRTAAKFIFVVGDDAPGSANDATMHAVIGTRWRSLARLQNDPMMNGRSAHSDWADMLSFECAWQMRDQQIDAKLRGENSCGGGARAPSEASTAPTASRLSDLIGFVEAGDEESSFAEAPTAAQQLAGTSKLSVEALLIQALEAAKHSAEAASQAAQAAEKAANAAQSVTAVRIAPPRQQGRVVKGVLESEIALWKVLLAGLLTLGLQRVCMTCFSPNQAFALGASFCAGWVLSMLQNCV
mmetsp:Transcript_28940/g.52713  ORF Transcript_28940/g.52713 Transcript_28940/m.52713 type:complete len:502 (+) Transcript_28940:61-1566(+)